MRDATYIVDGEIRGYDEKTGMMTITARCTDWPMLAKREVRRVKVQLLDNRKLSEKQRKSCYALIGEIADWMGDDKQSVKEYFKLAFWAEHLEDLNERIFSLSDAPMSLIAEFQRYLVRFIVQNQIPTKRPLLQMVDDIRDYVYSCLIGKQCAVCGKKADLHHVDRIGMGRDRDEIEQEGMAVLPLCREHHTLCHTMPQQEFDGMYHLEPIPLDRTLMRIYGIRRRKQHDAK